VTTDYDVIIVGGRPSGSTLAARLGQQGWRVLLIERAKLPALPGASCPIIYASTMNMLDEIGADETAYARNTPKIRRMVNAGELLKGEVEIPMVDGRDYGYAIDRARFDFALWENALRFPSVEGRLGYSLVDLLWEGDRVIGIVGQPAGGERETITARLVIGADGRFSTVARKAKAAERDEHEKFPTSIYYAYWKNTLPHDDRGAAAVAWGEGTGFGFLMMDSADDTTLIAVEGQTELLDPAPGQAEAMYMEMVRKFPAVWRRLEHAERITDVRGMRNIGNLYRQPGGDGWGLVGDAYHQKDPLDGQGIYDAVYTAKVLAAAVDDYLSGRKLWAQALLDYDREARAETHPMYRSTLDRVRDSFYPTNPEWFTRFSTQTWARWIFEDRLVSEQMGLMLTRQIKPSEMMSPPVIIGALLRGPLRDLSRFLDKQIQR
jgi:2-polyprenyl-6-methoxyphenol hydroxylase-like FAD-dependent oxidoreductase